MKWIGEEVKITKNEKKEIIDRLLLKTKKDYDRIKLMDTEGDPKKMYRVLNEVSRMTEEKILYYEVDDTKLAVDFANYDNKIEILWKSWELRI